MLGRRKSFPYWGAIRMDAGPLTRRESDCRSRKFWTILLLMLVTSACGSGMPAPTAPAPAPTPTPTPSGPPKPLDGATITVTAVGFTLDAVSASKFTLKDIHVYQGARLTFVNTDIQPHDVLSDPPHIHTDCPELNTAGYLVPGQSRATDPLNRIMTCGFHDHTHEGDAAFSGKVTIEAR
jgi:hypothetical protein